MFRECAVAGNKEASGGLGISSKTVEQSGGQR
jgi:hypothetical protein